MIRWGAKMGKGRRVRAARAAVITGTGIRYRGGHRPLPEGMGKEHTWIVLAAYAVNPLKEDAGEGYDLDMENLMTVDGPGCLHCERRYTSELASIPCPGGPVEGE